VKQRGSLAPEGWRSQMIRAFRTLVCVRTWRYSANTRSFHAQSTQQGVEQTWI